MSALYGFRDSKLWTVDESFAEARGLVPDKEPPWRKWPRFSKDWSILVAFAPDIVPLSAPDCMFESLASGRVRDRPCPITLMRYQLRQLCTVAYQSFADSWSLVHRKCTKFSELKNMLDFCWLLIAKHIFLGGLIDFDN